MVAVDYYFDSYAEIGLQRYMVSDVARTDAFAAAIKEAIQGGETVIDVGTGSGLLAILAAKAGARKVYALDQSSVAKAARETVDRNQCSDVVEVVNGNAMDFQLAEPADLIVSEWLGHFGFAERMLDDVLDCRDQNLKEGGRMLPGAVELRLAPIDSDALYVAEGPGFWKKPVHGIDFSHLEEGELRQALGIKTGIRANEVIAEDIPLLRLDLATAKKDDVWQSGKLRFEVQRDGELKGFGGWFVAELTPSVILDTGPSELMTHWMQTYFPVRPINVSQGESIEVRFALEPHPVERRSISLWLEFRDQSYCFSIH